MMIIDAHLDLAYNALRGRNLLVPASYQTADDEGTPSVSLPDLRCGQVGLVCATLFAEPALRSESKGYRSPEEANALARQQLDWYHQCHRDGALRLVTRRSELPDEATQMEMENREAGLPAIVLMEGADPILSPDDVPFWHSAAVRIVGLAWKQTRYAGGTGVPGPLTPSGIDLIRALDAHRIIHDVSHLAEEAFWQLLQISPGPLIASHSNCRALIPTDRHLSDDMIRALVARGAVLGINFFDRFLLSPDDYGKRRATLADVIRQIRHICDLVGNTRHVAIGTDMDGGFGREHLPQEIATSADLPKLADALSRTGFTPDDVRNILSDNWLRFLQTALP